MKKGYLSAAKLFVILAVLVGMGALAPKVFAFSYQVAIDHPITVNGLTVNLSGTASGDPCAGQVANHQVRVDWGDGNIDSTSSINFTDNGGTCSFSGTWTNSHTYTTEGDYTIEVKIYHAQEGGAESNDAQDSVSITLPQTSEISGMKYNDANNNGHNDSEAGLADWTITLSNGDTTSTTTTDQNGNYSFTDLADGTYTVCEVQQAGWQENDPSSGAECTTGTGYSITVANGDAHAGADFGNFQNEVLPTGSISGMKFNDENGNSVNDQEPSISGWPITITGPNDFTATTSTNSDGNYSFDNLADGTYTVCEGMEEGWHQTFPTASTTNEVACSILNGYSVTVTDGNSNPNFDFGNQQDSQPPTTATLTLIKHTVGGDGTFNFELFGDTSTSSQITTVDGSGSTEITLNSGTTTIEELVKVGWNFSTSSCQYDNESTGIIPVAGSEEVHVDTGDHVTCTFTNTKQTSNPGTGSISGYKFEDKNVNGVKDGSDVFLADWTISLFDGESTTTTTTDGSGNYSFGDLSNGTYTVCETLQGGWHQTSPTSGANCPSGTKGYSVTISEGEAHANVNFGNKPNTTGGGGGGGGGGSSFINPPGQVLGAATGPSDCLPGDFYSRSTGQLCPVNNTCPEYLTSYLHIGRPNPADQVVKLQTFLNTFQKSGLPTTGFFGKLTFAAVKAFQASQAEHIRNPWTFAGLPIPDGQWPTGYVYKTTRWWINTLNCPAGQGNFPLPPLP
jgi:hypothetical protein